MKLAVFWLVSNLLFLIFMIRLAAKRDNVSSLEFLRKIIND